MTVISAIIAQKIVHFMNFDANIFTHKWVEIIVTHAEIIAHAEIVAHPLGRLK